MKKIEQLIKELQMLINKPEMNKIIEEKMMDMWRDARNDATQEYIARQEVYEKNLIANLSEEERQRMAKSHHFTQTSDYGDEEKCYKCDMDTLDFERCPQYCGL